MPELPDIVLYIESLERLLGGKKLEKAIVKSPFLLRTFEPSTDDIGGICISGFRRMGKRVVWEMENGIGLVFHLMIAGRYHWRKAGRMPTQKNDLAAFQFEHGTMMLTEASKKKRASLHLIRLEQPNALAEFDRGGLELIECTLADFKQRITLENRTLKRALTDPRKFSGIGNAYSDEILLAAGLSPLKRTKSLNDDEIRQLHAAAIQTMKVWIDRLRKQTGESFPEKVRAFRPEMLAHGKYDQPCQICETKIQRIRYAENECNYCPRCQTGGKLLADRSLSRLLKGDWPRTIEELENPE